MGWGSLIKRDITDNVKEEEKIIVKSKQDLFQRIHDCIENSSSVDIANVVAYEVNDLDGLFAECTLIRKVRLCNWDIRNVKRMDGMFDGCANLESVEFVGFDFAKVKSMKHMFSGCKNLNTIIGIETWNVREDLDAEGMFDDCPVLYIKDGNMFVKK